MASEELFKKLMNRQDLNTIPIAHIVAVACAVIEEISKGENNE